MRLSWFAWWCFSALVSVGIACAAAPSDIPTPKSLLVDQAGVLDERERDILLARLNAIQQSERAQIGILLSSGTGGETLAEYALRVAEKWKLGRTGHDDGLLIVVIHSPAAVRIEVGYGLEGAIPDARASQWIDELLPAVRDKEIALGLERLLNRIDGVLPAGKAPAASGDTGYLFPDNPEWRGPFALAIFSLFSLFPMFVGRWGAIPAAFMLAAFLGGAAWMLWGWGAATYAVGGTAFVLPLLWGLNRVDDFDLPLWLRYARGFGNLMGVVMFFSIISLFVGVGLWASEQPVWPGFIFSGLLSVGLAAMLFPAAQHFLMVVLRSAMHFVFILVIVWAALGAFIPDATRIAFAVATIVTGLAALGLYLDSRERLGSVASGGRRWSLWLFGLAALVALPFAVFALILAVGGEDLTTQLVQGAAGGGTIAGILALAARLGLIAAIKVGLGGAFGGGGAGRSD